MKLPAALIPLATIWSENTGLDRLRYLASGVVWQVRKRCGHSFVTKLTNGSRIKVHPMAAFSGLFYCRWQERKDTLFIRDHAHLARAFVDVGANAGAFSAQLFDKFDRFYLFEAATSSYAALLETCMLNPAVDCRTFNLAITGHNGDVDFIDEGGHSGTSRIPHWRETADANTRVKAATLDKMLADVSGDMILKVDVEGAEQRVFDGAVDLFTAQRFKLVMFERLGRTKLEGIRAFFAKHGYVLFYVTDDGRPSRDEVRISTPLVNLFACPTRLFETISPNVQI